MATVPAEVEPAERIPVAEQVAGERSNIVRLYAARAVRGFGDGFAAIVLPAYLSEIGYTPLQIGIVATAALFGSAVMTLAVGFFAPPPHFCQLLPRFACPMVATPAPPPHFRQPAFVAALVLIRPIN